MDRHSIAITFASLATTCLATTCLVTTSLSAQNGDWPGFRGASHDGVSTTAKPPIKWDDETNICWKVELPGPGSSSPAIAERKIYIASYTGYGNYLDDGGDKSKLVHHLSCYAQEDGSQLWSTSVPGPLKKRARQMQLTEHGFASPTPIVKDGIVYAYFGRAGVVACDDKGKLLWQTDLGHPDPEAAVAKNQVVQKGRALSLKWGFAASPILHDGMLIVNCSEESNSIRALDQKTGELVWKHEAAELEGTAIPPAVFGTGDEAVLMIVLGGEIWGMNPKSGTFFWRVKTETEGGMSSMPIVDGDLAYVFGGDDISYAIRWQRSLAKSKASEKADGEAEDPRVAWTSSSIAISSPILHQGKLLAVRSNGMGLIIDAASGKVILDGRLPGRTGGVYASPVFADGRFYLVSRKRGTFVYTATDKFELLSRNELSGRAQCNASPALSGDSLFLRSDKFLYCIAKKD